MGGGVRGLGFHGGCGVALGRLRRRRRRVAVVRRQATRDPWWPPSPIKPSRLARASPCRCRCRTATPGIGTRFAPRLPTQALPRCHCSALRSPSGRWALATVTVTVTATDNSGAANAASASVTFTVTVEAKGWTAGVFEDAAMFKALCATPRGGTDANGVPFPDMQGATLDENNWLRSWSNDTYLWYDEIEDRDPACCDTPDYFQLLKTFARTPSGAPKDRFHFTEDTESRLARVRSGVTAGYGARFAVLVGRPPRGCAGGLHRARNAGDGRECALGSRRADHRGGRRERGGRRRRRLERRPVSPARSAKSTSSQFAIWARTPRARCR